MTKNIVFYYSKTGNNNYLAKRIASTLKCEIEQIKPKLNINAIQMFTSSLPNGLGVKKTNKKVTNYDNIILIGPLWIGHVASPIKGFLKKYKSQAKNIYFATCCGSSDEKKNDKFGYETIFKKLKALTGKKLKHCEAFPIVLALPKKDRENDELVMKTKLSEKNFGKELQERMKRFLKLIK